MPKLSNRQRDTCSNGAFNASNKKAHYPIWKCLSTLGRSMTGGSQRRDRANANLVILVVDGDDGMATYHVCHAIKQAPLGHWRDARPEDDVQNPSVWTVLRADARLRSDGKEAAVTRAHRTKERLRTKRQGDRARREARRKVQEKKGKTKHRKRSRTRERAEKLKDESPANGWPLLTA